jgi:hypothetical protein
MKKNTKEKSNTVCFSLESKHGRILEAERQLLPLMDGMDGIHLKTMSKLTTEESSYYSFLEAQRRSSLSFLLPVV